MRNLIFGLLLLSQAALGTYIFPGGSVGGGSVDEVTATSPLSSSGGTAPDISIQDAAADGSTKGAASFAAADFNATTGNISIDYANGQKAAADGTTLGFSGFTAADFNTSSGIVSLDYTNGQAASGSNKGFLTSADWTTFNNKAPTANPVFTGVSGFASGAVGAPSIYFTGSATTGLYSSASDTIDVAVAGTRQLTLTNAFMTLQSAGGGYTYNFQYSGGVQGIRFNASGSGSSYLELASGNFGYGFFTLNSAGWKNKMRLTRLDGAYYSQWWGEMGQIIVGGNTTGQKGVTFTVEGQPDKSNIGGTTTANASTTITGSGTSFLEHVGIGDRISLSSAASTYATVTAIASNTSLTVDAALGNGTSQTINLKRAIVRWDKAAGAAVYGMINDAGKWVIGEASTTETHALNTATGTPASDVLTLTNGPTGLAGNPAVYVKMNINGTDRYIPAW